MGDPQVERHPFEPFLPDGAKLLMLGSFPPQKKRWSMEFYYPNFINDFWRIIGIIFFDDKERFVDRDAKKFRLQEIKNFCSEKGIAMFDTATASGALRTTLLISFSRSWNQLTFRRFCVGFRTAGPWL